jgi:hypothetical protein
MQISLDFEQYLTRMVTLTKMIRPSSIVEVHRSRFKGATSQVQLMDLRILTDNGLPGVLGGSLP